MNKLLSVNYDKKQLPQIAVLGTLSVGLFGYFAWKMITPPPIQAATVPTSSHAIKSKTSAMAQADQSDPLAMMDAAAPTSTMRDPFIALVTNASAAQAAAAAAIPGDLSSQHGRMISGPKTGPLLPLSGISPLPPTNRIEPTLGQQQAGQSALLNEADKPQWTVTGIVTGGDFGSHMAILRQGNSRRFVMLGEMVDDTYRLIGVDRNGVELQRGSQQFRIPLGAARKTQPPNASGIPGAAPTSGPIVPITQPPTQQSSGSPIGSGTFGRGPIAAAASLQNRADLSALRAVRQSSGPSTSIGGSAFVQAVDIRPEDVPSAGLEDPTQSSDPLPLQPTKPREVTGQVDVSHRTDSSTTTEDPAQE